MSNNTSSYQRQLGGPGPPQSSVPYPVAGAATSPSLSPLPTAGSQQQQHSFAASRNYGPTVGPAASASVAAAAPSMSQEKLSQVTGYHTGMGLGGQQQLSLLLLQQQGLRNGQSGLSTSALVPSGFQGPAAPLMASANGGFVPYPSFPPPIYAHSAGMDKIAGPVAIEHERLAAMQHAFALTQLQAQSVVAPTGSIAPAVRPSSVGPATTVASSLGLTQQRLGPAGMGSAAGPIDSSSWASLYPSREGLGGSGGAVGDAVCPSSRTNSLLLSPPCGSTPTSSAPLPPSAAPAAANPPRPPSLSEPSAGRQQQRAAAAEPATSGAHADPSGPDNPRETATSSAAGSSAAAEAAADGSADGGVDNHEFELDGAGKRRRLTAEERLQRSRERNQLHARKTRQRKKAQLQQLLVRSKELQEEQRRLKQAITDRRTASILLNMSGGAEDSQSDGSGGGGGGGSGGGKKASRDHPPALADMSGGSPRPRAGMLRGTAESDGSTKSGSGWNGSDDLGSETTAGTSCSISSSGRTSSEANSSDGANDRKGSDGKQRHQQLQSEQQQQQQQLKVGNPGDAERLLELSKKTRSECTPEELEQIRRERNRMHAKRTRDRKKLHLEATEGMISRLEQENRKLRASMKASIGPSNGGRGGGASADASSMSTAADVKLPPPAAAKAQAPSFLSQRAPQHSTPPLPPPQQDQQGQQLKHSTSPHLAARQAQRVHSSPHLAQQFASHAFLHPGAAAHLPPPHLHGHVYPTQQQYMHPGHSHQMKYYPQPSPHDPNGGAGSAGEAGGGGGPRQDVNAYMQETMLHPNPHYLMLYQGWPAPAYGPPPPPPATAATPPLSGKSADDPQRHPFMGPEQMAPGYNRWDVSQAPGPANTPFTTWASAGVMPESGPRPHHRHHHHHHHDHQAPPASHTSTSSSGRQTEHGSVKMPSSKSGSSAIGGGGSGGGSSSNSSGKSSRKRSAANDKGNEESATTDNSSRTSPTLAAAEGSSGDGIGPPGQRPISDADREQVIEEKQHRLDRDLSRGCQMAWQKTRRERSAKRKRDGDDGGDGGGGGGRNSRRSRVNGGTCVEHGGVESSGVENGGGSSGEGSECSSSSSSWMGSSDTSSLVPGSTTSGETGSRGRSSGSDDSNVRRSESPSSSSSGSEGAERRTTKTKAGDATDGGCSGKGNGDGNASSSRERRSLAANSP